MTKKGEHQTPGSLHPLARLNEEQVVEIRNLHKHKISPTVLAKQYRMSVSTIERIVAHKSWKHVP